MPLKRSELTQPDETVYAGKYTIEKQSDCKKYFAIKNQEDDSMFPVSQKKFHSNIASGKYEWRDEESFDIHSEKSGKGLPTFDGKQI